MKKILIIILAISLWSCQSNVDTTKPDMPEGMGQLKSSLFTNVLEDNDITITILQGEDVVEQWSSVDEIPEVISLVVGDYSIIVKTNGELLPVSDKPYYNASTNFTIVEGELSYAALECKMLNMKVDITLSEALQTEFPKWAADIFLLEDMSSVIATFNGENNKTIYLKPAAFGVVLKDMSTSESRTVIFEEYGAAMYHNVKFE